LEDDIFEWHCTIRGPAGTEFEGGLYHLRILLPAEYPFRPPSLMVLTPNGRFELNTKICISFTNYHEELWQPAWGVRTAILGIQGFFPLKGQAAVGVGSIEYPSAERKRLAILSREWVCPHCEQPNLELLPDPSTSSIANPETKSVSVTMEDTTATPTSTTSVPSSITATDTSSSPSNDSSELPSASTHQPTVLVNTSHTPQSTSRSRPPVLLDALIGVILALVLAILFKRVL